VLVVLGFEARIATMTVLAQWFMRRQRVPAAAH